MSLKWLALAMLAVCAGAQGFEVVSIRPSRDAGADSSLGGLERPTENPLRRQL